MTGYKKEVRPGVWRLKVYLGCDGAGKKHWRNATVEGGERAAQRELNKLLAAAQTGKLAEPSQLTVSAYLDQWLKFMTPPRVRATTYEMYESLVRSHLQPRLGRILLAKLTPMQVQQYYAHLLREGRVRGEGGLSQRTVLHHHRVLHHALWQAVRWQLVDRNVVDAVDPPRVPKCERPILQADGLKRARTAVAGTWLELPMLIALHTSMRRGEVLGLRWSDVDLRLGILQVRQQAVWTTAGHLSYTEPKTEHGRRRIRLTDDLATALRHEKTRQDEHQRLLGSDWEGRDLIVCQDTGRPRTPDNLTGAWARMAQAHQLGVTFHDLRHTSITHLLAEGEDLLVVSRRAGHSSIKVTADLYGHVLPHQEDQAAERMNRALRRAMGDGTEP